MLLVKGGEVFVVGDLDDLVADRFLVQHRRCLRDWLLPRWADQVGANPPDNLFYDVRLSSFRTVTLDGLQAR